ncbi:MAG: ATP-binding protein, partial [Vallitaleaceae bacterium]|nr:ATP-binding protein [Vallitaleaceae bacterium]
MNSRKEQLQDKSIGYKVARFVISIPLYILMIPVYLIRGIRWLINYAYTSYTYSLRRSITANYLILYTIVGIVTFFVMIGGFLFSELSEKTDEIHVDIQALVERYVTDGFDDNVLEGQLARKADVNECGIYIVLENTDIKLDYISDNYKDTTIPVGLVQRFNFLIHEKNYSRQYNLYYSVENTGEIIRGKLLIFQPIDFFYGSLTKIAVLLIMCLLFGFGLIAIFGVMNVKKITNPLFTMTLAAKKLSISNMEERLDVSKAQYELRDLALTLNDMLDRLQEDYAKQKRFVSDVSHELRTPISIVNGYANMLERWGKKDEAILSESIDAIISEAKSMQILVENLLTLVRSDNQTLIYDKSIFSLNELVADVCKETAMINEKEQEVKCDIKGEITVNLDFQKIKQMLRIFVDNAVKYTSDRGTIIIECYKDEAFSYVHIKDTGIGIDKHDLPFLFDRFYRS